MKWNPIVEQFRKLWSCRTILKASLTDRTSCSYSLAAAPEIAAASGRSFNLTIDEKPAVYALDRAHGKQVWEISETLTGLAETNG